MKTKIKVNYVIPSKKESEELKRIINDVKNNKIPVEKRKLIEVGKGKI